MSHSIEIEWHGQSGCAVFAKKVAKIVEIMMVRSDTADRSGATIIVLDGTLGAGKTFFAQQLSRELGAGEGEVTSPTFVIIQSYATVPVIYHLDLYRVSDDDEFYELGIEEILDESNLVLIEWGEKFKHLLPLDNLHIEIEVLNQDDRKIKLTSNGPRSNAILESLRN